MSEKKVVTLVGKGDSWVYCPFMGEVWGISSVLGVPEMRDKHYDKVFAFDTLDKSNSYASEKLGEYLTVAKERGIPIVSTRKYATERYPLVQVFQELGTTFFRPTISYMIALAIYMKYDMLHIYGIDQNKEERYIRSRPFVDFWLGIALGRGVQYTIANKDFPSCTPTSMQQIVDKVKHPKIAGEQITQSSDGLTGSGDIVNIHNL